MRKRNHQATPPASSGKVSLNIRSPFTAAAALRGGIERSQLLSPTYRRVIHGIYVHADIPDSPALRAKAVLVAHPPGAFASHFTAARVWQLPTPIDPSEDVSVMHPNHRRRRRDVRTHLAPPNAVTRVVEGVPVSAPGQVFVELSAALPLIDLVALGDSLIRRGLCTLSELAHIAAPNRRARRAAAYVRAGVDSPMETRLRMLLLLAGLPEPQTNVRLRNEYGEVVAQFDLAYPVYKLVVQYDGRLHDSDLQRGADLDRREFLDHHGWRLIVVNSRGIYRHPEVTLDRVRQGLLDQGATGIRRRFSDAWRPHFPGWR
jgi:very-short-patch-repair endonuclease